MAAPVEIVMGQNRDVTIKRRASLALKTRSTTVFETQRDVLKAMTSKS
jgi:hypothetical protein